MKRWTWTQAAGTAGLALALGLVMVLADHPAAQAAVPAQAAPVSAPGAAPAARLPELERLVRAADPEALHALQGAQHDLLQGATYADHVAFLWLLRQAYVDNGDAASATDTNERIAQLAMAQDDDANAALAQLGRVAGLAARSPSEALAALASLHARHAQLHGPEFLARLQQAYGDVYLQLGQFDFALSHYLKALEISRQHPELLAPSVNSLRLALARVYVYTKAPARVLAVLAEIRPADGAMPPRSAVRAAVNEGIAHSMLGHHDQARIAYGKGLALARTYRLGTLEANALSNISDSYLQERRWGEAARTARDAIDVAERVHDTHTSRVARANLGFALAGAGDVTQGLTYIDGVLAAFRADGAQPDLANVLAEKSRTLEHAGLMRQALQALQEQQAVAAEVAAAERENAVALLQEQFNAQRRVAQIDGLRRENALKDAELRKRRTWQIIASIGAGLALGLCGFVYLLYQRSVRAGRMLRRLNDELAYHSSHDTLTGLMNRRSLRDAMAARAAAGTDAASQCFILLDIDHFKSINDRLGHGAGDAVLVEVAHRLRTAVGMRGMTLRWGGEEFLVYTEGGSIQDDALLVRDLLDAIVATPVYAVDGERLDVTVTAGALTVPPEAASAVPWEQALALADQALYLGKQNGRNRAYLAEASRLGTAQLRLTLIEPQAVPAPARQAA